MSKYEFYRIFRDTDSGGLAESPNLENDRLHFLLDGNYVTDWKTIHCSIFNPINKGVAFEDYQATIHGCRLCSQRMKNLFEYNKDQEDKIQWLDATVTWNGETRPYYVLHLYETVDVLDPVLSKWNPERKHYDALNKVYMRQKIGNRNIFSYPRDTIGLTVRAFLVKEMKKQKMTGMTWEPAIVH